MTDHAHPKFFQIFKLNLKRVLTYWTQIGATVAALGTGIGYLTISIYLKSIGRPDLVSAAMDAGSALVFWLVMTALVVLAYLLILASTTSLYGLTVSAFNKTPDVQQRLALWLLTPVAVGIAGFLVSIFLRQNWNQGYAFLGTSLAVCLVTALGLLSKEFREAITICATSALPKGSSERGAVALFYILFPFMLMGTVLSAAAPTALVLKGYVRDGARESLILLMAVSFFNAIAALAPAVVFYRSKRDPFTRGLIAIGVLLGVVAMVIAISPGTPTMIVYSTANLVNARSETVSHYLVDDAFKEADFDKTIWVGTTTLRDHPLVSAFPLFSFGDLLLLCPAKFTGSTVLEWPERSAYCIVTKNSKVTRMPPNVPTFTAKPATKPAA